MTKSLPRGIRNNNPGNVDRTKDRWLGMASDQSGDPRFIVFDTPEAGLRCLMRLLITYQETHGLNTIRGVIDRWAPTKENNTGAYVQHVCRLTGFDPDERLDFLDKHINLEVAAAIVRHENGPPEQYGRKEWYDDAAYERAAVMAGFAPSVKPLTTSRTMKAGVAGVALAAPVALFGAEDVSAVVSAVAPILGEATISTLTPWVTLITLGFTMWARWDDSRRKLR